MERIANFGWVLGRVKTNNQGKINELCLVCPSDASEHVFSPAQSVTIYGPAQSVTIYGEAAIEELRKLLQQEAP